MHKDFLVSFSGVDFPCVDRGFAREQSVQVVVRPEDIEVCLLYTSHRRSRRAG